RAAAADDDRLTAVGQRWRPGSLDRTLTGSWSVVLGSWSVRGPWSVLGPWAMVLVILLNASSSPFAIGPGTAGPQDGPSTKNQAPRTDFDSLLSRAGAYVESFQRNFGSVVAEER